MEINLGNNPPFALYLESALIVHAVFKKQEV